MVMMMKKTCLILALLLTAAIGPAFAQQNGVTGFASDPCALFPRHAVPIAGTATAKLITGPNSANGQIFICGVHLNSNTSTSSITLFAGAPNTGGTPCATSTGNQVTNGVAGGTINLLTENLGGAASGGLYQESLGYNNTTILQPVPPVPFASSTANYLEYDVCAYGAGTGTSGSILYVITP